MTTDNENNEIGTKKCAYCFSTTWNDSLHSCELAQAKIFKAIRTLCTDNNMVNIMVIEFNDYDQKKLQRRLSFVDSKGGVIYSQANEYVKANGEIAVTTGLLRSVHNTQIEKYITLEDAVKELIKNEEVE